MRGARRNPVFPVPNDSRGTVFSCHALEDSSILISRGYAPSFLFSHNKILVHTYFRRYIITLA